MGLQKAIRNKTSWLAWDTVHEKIQLFNMASKYTCFNYIVTGPPI